MLHPCGFLKSIANLLKWESRRKQTAGGGSWLSPPSTGTWRICKEEIKKYEAKVEIWGQGGGLGHGGGLGQDGGLHQAGERHRI